MRLGAVLIVFMLAVTGFFAVMADEARAETESPSESFVSGYGHCPKVEPAKISVMQYTGNLYQSQNKTAFEIARQKSKKYDVKMPVHQGNLGQAILRPNTSIDFKTYAGSRCIVVKGIDIAIFVDQTIEIAREHGENSCIYIGLYELEIELMQQDEKVINDVLEEFRHDLKRTIEERNTYSLARGVDFNKGLSEIRQGIQAMIDLHLATLENKLFETRREADLPEFYDEIKDECAGNP